MKNKDIIKAPKYLAVLREIEEKNGIITPEMVVKAAASPMSPLHKTFEWNDTEAAKRYRLFQARLLINSVRIEILGHKTEAFINAIVSVDNVPTRGYMATEAAMNDEMVYKQVLRGAARELEYWQQKYKTLRDLTGIINPEKLEALKGKLR